ncbi:regulatory protein RecX [Leucobacter tenebrionis]|uniref:regulatory protein RecX n=1 Tax=Leucobacter tenebrionis TaxID=2873270 RepID=UPI001CA754CD|nr:regulatory protein RecX [Leucobacter tenebrionis]QZY52594.1 recombination regulator RecX [Leucobacter tenebrionis]
MAVRFLPPPEERPAGGEESRPDLAEVIELRSLLGDRGWGRSSSPNPASEEPDPASKEPAAEAGEASAASESAAAEAGVAVGPWVGAGEPATVALSGAAEPGASAVSKVSESSTPEFFAEHTGGADDPDRASAYEDGVRLLARRARSSGELREELGRLEHPAHEVEAVIAEFEESHYLDDLGLARAVTEKLRETKRASRTQIRMKLRERRLPDAIIEEAVGELDTDEEFGLLREAAQDRARKLGGLDRQTAERRLLGFLARRGWSGEPAMRAAKEALDGNGGGSGVRFR